MLKKLAYRAVELASIVVLMSVLAATANAQSVNYHLLKKVPLGAAAGGGEYFDYLTADPSARHIYVSHGTEVVVVDADSGTVLGKVTGLKRCHGIALADAAGKGFITDGDEGKVFVFDVKTLKITGEIKTDKDSDSIIYDPASKRIFAFNGDPHTASVIDPATAAVVKTIELGGGPEFAVADGKGTVYNNLEDKNEVVTIDSQTLTIKAHWPVAPAGAPTAITMDREHRRVFSAGRNPQMLVMLDAGSGKVLQSLPISAGVDAAAFEDQTGLLFVSTREGMVHIFHEDSPDKLSVVQTLKTEYGAKTMALDTKTHNLYLSTAEFSEPAAGQANARRSPKPGTFHLLIYAR